MVASGKIPGSVNIPIRDLPKMIAKLPENKAAPILTYCKVGYRAGMAPEGCDTHPGRRRASQPDETFAWGSP